MLQLSVLDQLPACAGHGEDEPIHESPELARQCQQVQDLQAWSSLPTHRGITAHPREPHEPQLWILGSSDHGAQLAAHLGLPYAFACIFTDGQCVERALDLYRTRYWPSERYAHPQATVCVWALAADDGDKAWHHAVSRDEWRIARTRGQVAPLQDPTVIAARGFDDAAASTLRTLRDKAFVGDVRQVGARLRQLAASLELDELVINTWAYFPKVRQRSYALLAKEFALSTAPGAAA